MPCPFTATAHCHCASAGSPVYISSRAELHVFPGRIQEKSDNFDKWWAGQQENLLNVQKQQLERAAKARPYAFGHLLPIIYILFISCVRAIHIMRACSRLYSCAHFACFVFLCHECWREMCCELLGSSSRCRSNYCSMCRVMISHNRNRSRSDGRCMCHRHPSRRRSGRKCCLQNRFVSFCDIHCFYFTCCLVGFVFKRSNQSQFPK
jgi:hypothetical protein